jgi:hypothetical protein
MSLTRSATQQALREVFDEFPDSDGLDLHAAALYMGCSVNAARTRVQKSTDFNLELIDGRTCVVRAPTPYPPAPGRHVSQPSGPRSEAERGRDGDEHILQRLEALERRVELQARTIRHLLRSGTIR